MSVSVLAAIRRRLRQQSGFSLIELLVVMSLFLFVMGAAMSVMDTGGKAGPRDAERANAIREQQVGLYRMIRELRQAHQVLGTSPRSMEVLVRIARNGTHENRHVAYYCSEESPGKCIRKETTIGQPLPANGEVVIDRVLNWTASSQAVFAFPDDPSNGVTPSYVTVRVEVPAAGEKPNGFRNRLTLEDGFHARNMRIVGYQ